MKRFFVKGLFAVLPIVLTASILYFFIAFLYNSVGVPIGEALKWAAFRWNLIRVTGDSNLPDENWAWFLRWGAPVIGFCVAILLTLIVGFVVATFFGRKLFRWYEAILKRVPLIGYIYPYARQFTDFFFGEEKKRDFKTAVAVPYPMPGSYAIGFVTAEGIKALNEATGKRLISVFVPNAPMPFSGFVLYVAREELIPLPISVEEAMGILISAGVIHPKHQAVGGESGAIPAVSPALVKSLTEKDKSA